VRVFARAHSVLWLRWIVNLKYRLIHLQPKDSAKNIFLHKNDFCQKFGWKNHFCENWSKLGGLKLTVCFPPWPPFPESGGKNSLGARGAFIAPNVGRSIGALIGWGISWENLARFAGSCWATWPGFGSGPGRPGTGVVLSLSRACFAPDCCGLPHRTFSLTP